MKKTAIIVSLTTIAIVVWACYGIINSVYMLDVCTTSPCTIILNDPAYQTCGTSSNMTHYTCVVSSNTYAWTSSYYTNGTCMNNYCQGAEFSFSLTFTNKLPQLVYHPNCGG
jgi:hypothetical protein